MFNNSIQSYPTRGKYGKPNYPGNTTGFLIKDFLKTFHPLNFPNKLFVDVAEGSGTSRDVSNELGINYVGLDLKTGFDVVNMDLSKHIGSKAQTVFFHPPYHHIIEYSGNVWGSAPDHRDLSHCISIEDFLSKIQKALINIYNALDRGGIYGFLIGNIRKNGKYTPLSSYCLMVAPGKMKEEIIKEQHNCSSDRGRHRSMRNFVPIAHEKLLVFEKTLEIALFEINKAINRLDKLSDLSWKNFTTQIIKLIAPTGTDPVPLRDIYKEASKHKKTSNKKHWKEKIRQTLYIHPDFVKVSTGNFRLKEYN